jgi:hypothetical protein
VDFLGLTPLIDYGFGPKGSVLTNKHEPLMLSIGSPERKGGESWGNLPFQIAGGPPHNGKLDPLACAAYISSFPIFLHLSPRGAWLRSWEALYPPDPVLVRRELLWLPHTQVLLKPCIRIVVGLLLTLYPISDNGRDPFLPL